MNVRRRTPWAAATAAALLLGAAGAAGAAGAGEPAYRVQRLSTAPVSAIYAANDRGDAVGTVSEVNGDTRAVLWRPDGREQVLAVPAAGAGSLAATAVSPAGKVGVIGPPGTAPRAWLWSAGRVTALGAGTPVAVNDRGQVLLGVDGGTELWDHGRRTALGPGAQSRSLTASGLAGGLLPTADVCGLNPCTRAALWQDGRPLRLAPAEPGVATEVVDVTERGSALVRRVSYPDGRTTWSLWQRGGDRPIPARADSGWWPSVNDRDEVAILTPAGAPAIWRAGRTTPLALPQPGLADFYPLLIGAGGDVVGKAGEALVIWDARGRGTLLPSAPLQPQAVDRRGRVLGFLPEGVTAGALVPAR